MTSPCSNIVDVAVIGGGVSGAYTAYRLLKTDPSESPVLQDILKRSGKEKLDVRLIEMSNRIGGRLWSIELPNLPNLPAEMGGMCFSQLQRNVYGLTKELGLETKRSHLFSPNHLQYFRGHHFWAEDYEPPVDPTLLRDDYYPNVVPFFLEEDEKWQHPSKLLAKVFEHVPCFKEMTKLTNDKLESFTDETPDYVSKVMPYIYRIEKFLREAEFVDPVLKTRSPLYEYGLWNVIVNLLSPDACNLLQTATTLHFMDGNWNLLNYSIMTMYSELFNNSYHKLTAGYDALPKTLVNKFKGMGGVVNMGVKLLDLNHEYIEGERLLKLTVGSTTNPSIQSTDIYARNVVLALPQRALKLLFGCGNSIFSKEQLDLLDTVTTFPAYKLILVYDEPWWEQIKHPARHCWPAEPITSGFSLTDLPLQACYYVGQDSVENKHSLLIASLGDSIVEGFWSGLRPSLDPCSWLNPEPYVDPKSKIVIEAQQQLKELHGIDIPDPVAGLFWDWKDDPFGGGLHLWKPGVKSWQVASKIRQPNSDLNVFLCGEAYSEQQGWVEGALNSAEMVLEEHFKLPRPNWVPDTYQFAF